MCPVPKTKEYVTSPSPQTIKVDYKKDTDSHDRSIFSFPHLWKCIFLSQEKESRLKKIHLFFIFLFMFGNQNFDEHIYRCLSNNEYLSFE